jgi:hypothetical protein
MRLHVLAATRILVFGILAVIASDASSQEDPRNLTCKNINTTSADFRIGLLVGTVLSVQTDLLYHHTKVLLPDEDMGIYETKLLALCSLNPESSVHEVAFAALFDAVERILHPMPGDPCDRPEWTEPVPPDSLMANIYKQCVSTPRPSPQTE